MQKLLLICFITTMMQCREIKMLAVLTRHGARNSYSILENPGTHGEITQNGIRMSYLLGKYLRQSYSNFFPSKFNYNDNSILASSTSRTQLSAQATMLGVYDFGSLSEEIKVDQKYFLPEWNGFEYKEQFKTALPEGNQPVPVHSFLEYENYVFRTFAPELCPKLYQKLKTENKKDVEPLLVSINALLPSLVTKEFDYHSVINVDKIETVQDFLRLPDYYMSQRFKGNKLGLNKETYVKLERLEIAAINYLYFRFPEENKYSFTEHARILLKEMEETEKRLKNGETVNRFLLMAGHDLNIIMYLLAAKLMEDNCLVDGGECTLNPPYSSALIFEVVEENKEYFVETSINGKAIKFCESERYQRCTLKEFNEKLGSLMFKGDEQELRHRYCVNRPFSKNRLLISFISFNVVGMITIMFFIKKTKRD